MHKAGFVNIIGLPNVGKSTLMNALSGEKLAIVSPKSQTTRQRVIGIINEDDYQVVISDTPGFINQPAYRLQSRMNDAVTQALDDADLLLFVTDKYQKEDEQGVLIEFLQKTNIPFLILLNKMDLCEKPELEGLKKRWSEILPSGEFMPLSAASGINVKKIIKKIVSFLPESPAYYDKDQLTDRNIRFFVAEIVREKIFLNYTHEIPYSCQVAVDWYKEDEKIDRIKCNIYVERDSQKAILIGKNGEAMKKVGVEARKDMEAFLGKQVYLELQVRVKDNWRNDDNDLKNFGYSAG